MLLNSDVDSGEDVASMLKLKKKKDSMFTVDFENGCQNLVSIPFSI